MNLPSPAAWAAATLLGLVSLSANAQSAPAVPEASFEYTTRAGDTLIGLGRRLLVRPADWPALARANRLANADRIPTGTRLRVPLALMRSEALAAQVTATSGGVQAGGAAVAPGAALTEGATLTTAADGHATVRLADGTVLRLRPDSRLDLTQARRFPDAEGASRGAVRLDQGRVDVQVVPRNEGGRAGFEVRTPQGVLGVRGTEFRASAEAGTTRGEVLRGRVAVAGAPSSAEREVAAGFGTVVDAQGRVAEPVPLLPAPPTAALPVLQEQPLVRFTLPAVAGANAYRAQVLPADASADRVLAEQRLAGPELRVADLPDGDYRLLLRAIDAQGLEGVSAEHRFKLKARPEPPLPAAPQPRAQLTAGAVVLSWAAQGDAAAYRLQIAATPDFAAPVRDAARVEGTEVRVDGLPLGTWHWRLASVRGADDRGPWGAPRSFTLRPPPPTPPAPSVGEHSARFSWSALPGQRFDFQVARTADFAAPVIDEHPAQPEIDVPHRGSGRFYLRLRAIDADGYIGPWSATQQYDVPNCLKLGDGATCLRLGGEPLVIAP